MQGIEPPPLGSLEDIVRWSGIGLKVYYAILYIVTIYFKADAIFNFYVLYVIKTDYMDTISADPLRRYRSNNFSSEDLER